MMSLKRELLLLLHYSLGRRSLQQNASTLC